jgi:hypothetical protein
MSGLPLKESCPLRANIYSEETPDPGLTLPAPFQPPLPTLPSASVMNTALTTTGSHVGLVEA